MIREIKKGDNLIALLVDNADIDEGTHPVTQSPWSLQLLMMKRKPGHIFAKHTHAPGTRSTPVLQEAIVVTKGRLSVVVCDRKGTDIETLEVSTGQCIFLVDGGYKIEVLEDATFYEFKNGPHSDDKVLL